MNDIFPESVDQNRGCTLYMGHIIHGKIRHISLLTCLASLVSIFTFLLMKHKTDDDYLQSFLLFVL